MSAMFDPTPSATQRGDAAAPHGAVVPAGWAHAAPAAPHRLSAAGIGAVLDEIDTGVLLCDAQCRVVLMNEAARQELDDGGVLRLEADGRLAIDSTTGQALLRRAVHNAACSGLRQLAPLRVGERALMVAVQPLAQAAAAGQPTAVLLLGRRQLAPGLAVEMLASLHALTGAERRVLKGLLDGRRVAALAAAHGVAVSTVRTQVATLRAKFGVRSIDDLVRLVAEMPPMVSALRGARRRLDS